MDDLTDIVGYIVNSVADIINWASQAWDDVKEACAYIVSGAICFGDADCMNHTEGFVKSGIDIGIGALGFPPELPNFHDFADMGKEYLTKSLIEQAGVNPEVLDYANEFTPEIVKPGMDKFVAQSQSGDSLGLIPEPDLQAQPAYMIVEIKNNQDAPTLQGTLTITEPNHLFQPKSVAVPSLQPGESLKIPMLFSKVPKNEFETDFNH